MKTEIERKSQEFWLGYKTYVNGGKQMRITKNGKPQFYGGIEPFENLTENQKKDWANGIEFAQKEKEECKKIWYVVPKKRKSENYEPCMKMLKEGLNFYDIAAKLGTTLVYVHTLAREKNMTNEIENQKKYVKFLKSNRKIWRKRIREINENLKKEK